MAKSDLEAIADLAIKHNFYVLTDEVYSRILYEGVHDSLISLPGHEGANDSAGGAFQNLCYDRLEVRLWDSSHGTGR